MIFKEHEIDDKKVVPGEKRVPTPTWNKTLVQVSSGIFIFFTVLLIVTPWLQTSHGTGRVIAFDPNDRVQKIHATIAGRVNRWLVKEGQEVEAGDSIVEIIDNDPLLIERLKSERDAVLKAFEAAKTASETALINFRRQKSLFDQGLSARTKFEKSKITYKKLLAAEATAAANLAKVEVRYARQQAQLITAPRDGTILRILHGSGSIFVNEGDTVATFVPTATKPAAEIYVSGNDLPLIYPGRSVRLQFEGWPAIQFSGWPSIAIGTFGASVVNVDASASYNGKFRVIVVPEEGEEWPDERYLRQGTRVYGWVLLNTVRLGFEIWRQFNGFPPDFDEPIEISNSKEKKKKKKKKKEKEYKNVYKD